MANLPTRTLRNYLSSLPNGASGTVLGTDLTKTTVQQARPEGYATAAQGAKADTAMQPAVYDPNSVGGDVFDSVRQIGVTAVGVAAKTIPASTTSFRTSGYYAAGDSGGALYVRVSSEPAHAGKLQSADGAWWALAERVPTAYHFAARGNYVADDTQPVRDWIAYQEITGIKGNLGEGVFGITDGIVLPREVSLEGVQAPIMGPFPLSTDDKRFLRPGYKHLIPGSTLIFKGTGTASESPANCPGFLSTFRYALYVEGLNSPARVKSVGIIMDMDVFDAAGVLTPVSQDNRSDYEVGIFYDSPVSGIFEDVTCFGYWSKAGTVLFGANPDSNAFVRCRSSGERGFVVWGTGSNGLSGTVFDDFEFYANDHHSRDDQFGTCALMIDGNGFQINGTYISKGKVHTYCNTPIIFGACNDVAFKSVVFELPDYPDKPGADTSRFIGIPDTGNLWFDACRFTDNPIYGNDCIASQIDGYISIDQGGPVSLSVAREIIKNGWIMRDRFSALGPQRQMAATIGGSDAGFVERLNPTTGHMETRYENSLIATMQSDGTHKPRVSSPNVLNTSRTDVTIAGEAITRTRSFHTVRTGTGSAGTLRTINGGVDGDILTLRAGLSTEPVTISSTGGNIRNTSEMVLAGFVRVMLVYDGSHWCPV